MNTLTAEPLRAKILKMREQYRKGVNAQVFSYKQENASDVQIGIASP